MQTITINSIIGAVPPYNIYACNVYGNLCVLLATISSPVPPQIIINIPPPYETAPALGIKIISSVDDCEDLHILYCESPTHPTILRFKAELIYLMSRCKH